MDRRWTPLRQRNSRPLVSALLVLAQIPLVLVVPPDIVAPASAPITVAALAGQAVALCFGRRAPGLVLAATTVIDCALLVESPGASTGGLGIALAVYGMRREASRRRALTWMVPLALLDVVTAAVTGPGPELDAAWGLPLGLARVLLLFSVPAFIAELVIGRRRLIDALRERAELAEREQAAVARHAAQQQRTQMARELHDIAAHHLTGIIVSAQAANALADTDRDAQRRYLAALQADARAALENIRLTVGLLRSDERTDARPAPSIDDLPHVIDEARERGMPVELVEHGRPRAIGPVAGVIVIRGVQEALANVLKHAPGARTTVTVTWLDRALRVEVLNSAATSAPLPVPTSGYGLEGLRERLALVGGTLEAGPSPLGWRTAFELPVDPPPADPSPDPSPAHPEVPA